jgi:alginate O-acetyltransferase complex protein AlgI
MLFNSLGFVVFFILVLIVYYLPIGWKAKKIHLLIASYLFYAAWNPPLVILLWISTMVDWLAGNRLEKTDNKFHRKLLLLVSVFVNLGFLVFFKYGGFLLDNFVYAASYYNIDFQPARPDIILPMGISFYTFQTMSYTIDIFRKRSKPARSFLDFALYVTFFPQLVAGPIVRSTDLIPQFAKPKKTTKQQFTWGLFLLTLGLFMKIVLADSFLASPVDTVFGESGLLNSLDAWLGVMAFSGQIFFDFAGYSTCAIGIAYTLGFHLPHNFLFPYAAIGFSDLWRRWHITLSSWLRDYLYIPLGGNRTGPLRTYFNLMLTMLLGGLWHGAAWTFVIWGGLHGLFLSVERFAKNRWSITFNTAKFYIGFPLALLTYFFVNLTWVFFRAQDFGTAWNMLISMFSFSDGARVLHTLDIIIVSLIIVGMLLVHWFMRNTTVKDVLQKTDWKIIGIGWAIMLFLLIISQGSGDSFIYFQF